MTNTNGGFADYSAPPVPGFQNVFGNPRLAGTGWRGNLGIWRSSEKAIKPEAVLERKRGSQCALPMSFPGSAAKCVM